MTRYHLEDLGQDMMYIDIEGPDVIGIGPCGVDCFKGYLSYDYFSGKMPKKGGYLKLSQSPDHEVLTLRYKITKVERIKETTP